MAYTNYSASQAVSRAKATTKWTTAMCLNFVMYCLHNERVGLYDANAAWAAAEQKEYGTPPAGAPVYFAGYDHGHIALSLGGGRVRSTDVPYATEKGTLAPVGDINIRDLERDWGIKWLGWSRDYAGLVIRGLEETNTNYSPPPVVVPEEDIMATIADLRKVIQEEVGKATWTYPLKNRYTDQSWSAGSYVEGGASWANNADSQSASALAKLTALGDRQKLIDDVKDAVLNAPVPNHDPNPDDDVPPTSYSFRSYPVMANWRAAQLQGQVTTLQGDVNALKTALTTLIEKVDALPKG